MFREYFFSVPKIFGRISALEEVDFNFVGLFSECFFFDVFFLKTVTLPFRLLKNINMKKFSHFF